MAASVKESLEDLTTCPICCEQYQDPRVLPCLHTYCKHCMERLFAETTTICCPECRKEVEIQDINELKVNFQMNKLISVLETIAKKSSLCQKHEDEVLKRFCETCDQLICCECAIVDHKGHQHDFFDEITKKRKVWLEKGIVTGNATKEKVNAVLTNVHDMQETVNENSGNVEKEIDEAINQQIQALEEKRSILKQQLKDVVKSENLATQEDDLVMHLTKLESAIDFIRNVLNRGSDIQIVSLTNQVIAQLFEVVEQPFNNDINVATARLRIDSEMLRENIKHFAEVILDFSLVR